MQISLGHDLDGQRGIPPAPLLDAVSVGPLGLLNILETQLGLLRCETPAAQRILQYRDGLKRLDHAGRFYHHSFAADQLGTAATLLGWRDQWHLHGWPGISTNPLDDASSRRLRDLSAVEREASKTLAPCLGERLALILEALQHCQARIAGIELCEPLASWPLAWRKVLARLPHKTVAIKHSTARPDSLLGELQAALAMLADGGQPAKLRWRDDGSILIAQSETRLLAAHWLAEQISQSQPDASNTLLLAPDAEVLDEVLVAANLPRQGFKESSPFRPALQVVPLALGQLWKPLDLYGLLKFLTHPICPVPAVARNRLAEMLASTPGIGHGPAWDETLAAIESACQNAGFDWAGVRQRIATWVEHPRYEPASGAPLSAVAERLTLLANYFRGRLKDAEANRQSAFASGQAQALACLEAIKALALQGESHIQPQQLQTLLQQASAQGTTNPLLQPEVGACRCITQPGAAVAPARRVVWWQLAAPALPNAWPWSLDEQKSLRQAGIDLPEIEAQLERQALAWQKPIFAAQELLTVILPPPGTEVHPLWLLLESLFAKGHAPCISSLETQLTATEREIQPYRPLPGYKRWWQLPEAVSIPTREKESYSSLDAFLFNPYQWVLTYPAQLKPSSLLAVSEGFQLFGNLAHHLVERYVAEPTALTQDEVTFQAWFETRFEALIDDEGATLRMPGQREALESFRRKLYAAMQQLRQHCRSAKVVKIEAETKLAGQFTGGKIEGYGDLLLTRADGLQAIVDMKWAGGKKYPDKLATNRHLQLAIYGEILRQQTGQWPRLAYFLLNDGELIATDRDFFPDARLVWKKPEVADEGAAHLWQRFLKTWQWRRDQLDRGLIEVAIEENDDPSTSTPPEDALALEILNQNYNPYLALAGWGDKS